MTPLEKFERSRIERERCDQVGNFYKTYQAAFDAEVEQTYRAEHKKGRFHLRKAIEKNPDIRRNLHAQWLPGATRAQERHKHQRDRMQKVLDTLAQKVELIPNESYWTRYRLVSDSSYHTQGWGSTKYAKGEAQNALDHAAAQNIPCYLRRAVYNQVYDTFTYHEEGWEVWVALTESECEVLRLKPSISLREQIRLCWKRGTNPRVMNPFLPDGLEERMGLDYFGNDLRKKSGPPCPYGNHVTYDKPLDKDMEFLRNLCACEECIDDRRKRAESEISLLASLPPDLLEDREAIEIAQ